MEEKPLGSGHEPKYAFLSECQKANMIMLLCYEQDVQSQHFYGEKPFPLCFLTVHDYGRGRF